MSDDDLARAAVEALQADQARRDSEHRDLVTFWESLDREARNAVLLAEYRCRAGSCLLLHLFRLPSGRFWYKPAYDLSPTVAETETAPSARRTRTADGHRKWSARAGSLDEIVDFEGPESPRIGLDLDCDHLRRLFVPCGRLDADAAGVPGPQRPIFWPEEIPGRL